MNAQDTVPRLRVGAGEPDGSTGLCAMQVISWETGDTTITDLPDCADTFLALVVQQVNDTVCHVPPPSVFTEDPGRPRWLCPSCAVEVLALAHRTVGTRMRPDPIRVWREIGGDVTAAELGRAMRQGSDPRAPSVVALAARYAMTRRLGIPDVASAHRIVDRFEELTGRSTPDDLQDLRDPRAAPSSCGGRVTVGAGSPRPA